MSIKKFFDGLIPKRYSRGSYEYLIIQEGLMTSDEIESLKKENSHAGLPYSGFSFCISCINNGYFTYDEFLKILRMFDDYHYSAQSKLKNLR